MKRILFAIVATMLILPAMAQEEEKESSEIDFLFKKHEVRFTGAYMSPEMKFSKVNGDNALFIGGHLAANFNRKMSYGFAAYVNVLKNEFSVDPDMTLRTGFGYVGMFNEYVMYSERKVHLTFPMVIGVGGVTVWDKNEDLVEGEEWNDVETSAAFVFEPGINVEVNLTKFMRFTAGASYRLVRKSDLVHLSDKDLSCFAVNAGFRFGFYR